MANEIAGGTQSLGLGVIPLFKQTLSRRPPEDRQVDDRGLIQDRRYNLSAK
jgi:hypothetical protein